ncbi:hypothetical protein [Haloarcula salina]|uniref:Uncharacterized protein n=1 Tax=Haloarcula salina TaxID=1429914 RepID=A0AA41FX03_9EURY|nr:hypothetical protein [Haloarcula salina]MBV0900253.1 hypothetical protein [Haloarcula salina]
MSDEDERDETEREAAAVVRAIDDIGIDRLTDAIVDAWEQLDEERDGPTWPREETRYRLELTDPDEAVGLDALAAVLDASPRVPESAFVHLGLGRRADLGDERFAVETIASHGGVTAADGHTTGRVPLTGETFDALARVHGDALRYAVVCDDDGRAIVERDWTTLTFSLPASAVGAVRAAAESLDDDRIERER